MLRRSLMPASSTRLPSRITGECYTRLGREPSTGLRRPCGPLPPALRARTPAVALLAHAVVQCARSAAQSFPLGSPWRSHGRVPLDRRIPRGGFPADPQGSAAVAAGASRLDQSLHEPSYRRTFLTPASSIASRL